MADEDTSSEPVVESRPHAGLEKLASHLDNPNMQHTKDFLTDLLSTLQNFENEVMNRVEAKLEAVAALPGEAGGALHDLEVKITGELVALRTDVDALKAEVAAELGHAEPTQSSGVTGA